MVMLLDSPTYNNPTTDPIKRSSSGGKSKGKMMSAEDLSFSAMTFGNSGSILSKEQKIELRKKFGYCVTCKDLPTQLYEMCKSKLNPIWFNKKPINSVEGNSYMGKCLLCHPEVDPRGPNANRGSERSMRNVDSSERSILRKFDSDLSLSNHSGHDEDDNCSDSPSPRSVAAPPSRLQSRRIFANSRRKALSDARNALSQRNLGLSNDSNHGMSSYTTTTTLQRRNRSGSGSSVSSSNTGLSYGASRNTSSGFSSKSFSHRCTNNPSTSLQRSKSSYSSRTINIDSSNNNRMPIAPSLHSNIVEAQTGVTLSVTKSDTFLHATGSNQSKGLLTSKKSNNETQQQSAQNQNSHDINSVHMIGEIKRAVTSSESTLHSEPLPSEPVLRQGFSHDISQLTTSGVQNSLHDTTFQNEKEDPEVKSLKNLLDELIMDGNVDFVGGLLVDAMQNHINNKQMHIMCLQTTNDIVRGGSQSIIDSSPDLFNQIIASMTNFPASSEIQHCGCSILSIFIPKVATTNQGRELLLQQIKRCCEIVISALHNHMVTRKVLEAAFETLRSMSCLGQGEDESSGSNELQSKARLSLTQAETVKSVARAMKDNPLSSKIQLDGCAIISNTSIDMQTGQVDTVPIIALQAIVQILDLHTNQNNSKAQLPDDDENIIPMACNALNNLMYQGGNVRNIRHIGEMVFQTLGKLYNCSYLPPICQLHATEILEKIQISQAEDESMEEQPLKYVATFIQDNIIKETNCNGQTANDVVMDLMGVLKEYGWSANVAIECFKILIFLIDTEKSTSAEEYQSMILPDSQHKKGEDSSSEVFKEILIQMSIHEGSVLLQQYGFTLLEKLISLKLERHIGFLDKIWKIVINGIEIHTAATTDTDNNNNVRKNGILLEVAFKILQIIIQSIKSPSMFLLAQEQKNDSNDRHNAIKEIEKSENQKILTDIIRKHKGNQSIQSFGTSILSEIKRFMM